MRAPGSSHGGFAQIVPRAVMWKPGVRRTVPGRSGRPACRGSPRAGARRSRRARSRLAERFTASVWTVIALQGSAKGRGCSLDSSGSLPDPVCVGRHADPCRLGCPPQVSFDSGGVATVGGDTAGTVGVDLAGFHDPKMRVRSNVPGHKPARTAVQSRQAPRSCPRKRQEVGIGHLTMPREQDVSGEPGRHAVNVIGPEFVAVHGSDVLQQG